MKQYAVNFSTTDPRLNTGLSPTFVLFYNLQTGQTLPPPGISETFSGSGAYSFSYEPTMSIYWQMDGATTGLGAIRYVTGVLDPIQAVDDKVGYNTDSFGSTSVDPTTIFGFVKRALEWAEGDKFFNKSLALWMNYSRAAVGASVLSGTLLRDKQLSDNVNAAQSTGL